MLRVCGVACTLYYLPMLWVYTTAGLPFMMVSSSMVRMSRNMYLLDQGGTTRLQLLPRYRVV